MKEEGTDYCVHWRAVAKAPSYTKESNRCKLCLREKLEILALLKNKARRALNTRTMMMGKCPHKSRHLLGNWKPEAPVPPGELGGLHGDEGGGPEGGQGRQGVLGEPEGNPEGVPEVVGGGEGRQGVPEELERATGGVPQAIEDSLGGGSQRMRLRNGKICRNQKYFDPG